ncbi:hypothetical protein EEJ31_10665 [Cryobacterium tepidiphilum]|uniref:Secreted protein n=1 Tax=Cryobacterium tepidiphilum TaxID=2486026 RepID=A0A3M8L3B1_9MICO|nr:hypothetical protein EEJ31_10665 [Cryobacterium tepidiphilum]
MRRTPCFLLIASSCPTNAGMWASLGTESRSPASSVSSEPMLSNCAFNAASFCSYAAFCASTCTRESFAAAVASS